MKNIQSKIQNLREKIDIEVKHVEKLTHELFQIAWKLIELADNGKITQEQAAYEIMDLVVSLPPQLSGGFLTDLSEFAFKLEVKPGNKGQESAFKTDKQYQQAWQRLKKILKSGLNNIDSKAFYQES